ncbi:Thioredoxin [Seminavis robusta]|uniref:Thioredoxin n=1 Tax=Seminavis robusta TaxID=568900 RepID=A0A9N8EBL7_9STRA|nr:Thioredoxin [Seminavis robusta]|eukprot:Sro855_g211340.1 Thioredoxin (208) ;mRNA; f:6879-7502
MVSTPPMKNLKPRIGSKLRYSSTTEDVPQAATTPEFESKVRNILKPPSSQSTEEKIQGLPNMRTASRKDELRQAVLENEDRLTVVRFHAPYCAQCKRIEPMLRSFARRNPDIQFIDVAYTQDRATRQLVHSLGVPSFPYCHVYHPASLGLVEEHSMNGKFFQDLTKVIESYQDGGCDLPPNPNDDGVYGSPYKSLIAEKDNKNSKTN